MKKLFIITLSVLFSATIPSQGRTSEFHSGRSGTFIKNPDKKGSDVKEPEGMNVCPLSKVQFLEDFGSVSNVKWTRADNLDQATFMNNGVQATAFYDDKSELIGTTVTKQFKDLPAIARKRIKKQFKSYKVDGVIYFKDNEFNNSDLLLFGDQFPGKDNYFVELNKNNERIVLRITPMGNITYFKNI